MAPFARAFKAKPALSAISLSVWVLVYASVIAVVFAISLFPRMQGLATYFSSIAPPVLTEIYASALVRDGRGMT